MNGHTETIIFAKPLTPQSPRLGQLSGQCLLPVLLTWLPLFFTPWPTPDTLTFLFANLQSFQVLLLSGILYLNFFLLPPTPPSHPSRGSLCFYITSSMQPSLITLPKVATFMPAASISLPCFTFLHGSYFYSHLKVYFYYVYISRGRDSVYFVHFCMCSINNTARTW